MERCISSSPSSTRAATFNWVSTEAATRFGLSMKSETSNTAISTTAARRHSLPAISGLVDMPTHEAVTTAAKRGKRHKTKTDKFGRQRIQSSSPLHLHPRACSVTAPRLPHVRARPARLQSPLPRRHILAELRRLRGRSASQSRWTWMRQTPPRSRSDNGLDCGSSSGKFIRARVSRHRGILIYGT